MAETVDSLSNGSIDEEEALIRIEHSKRSFLEYVQYSG